MPHGSLCVEAFSLPTLVDLCNQLFWQKKITTHLCSWNECLDLVKGGIFPLNWHWPSSDDITVPCVQPHKDKIVPAARHGAQGMVSTNHTAMLTQPFAGERLLCARREPHRTNLVAAYILSEELTILILGSIKVDSKALAKLTIILNSPCSTHLKQNSPMQGESLLIELHPYFAKGRRCITAQLMELRLTEPK